MGMATGLCDSGQSALLIVDIQTHLTAIMPAKVLARLQRNSGLLLRAAGLLDLPVFRTEQYPQGLGPTEPDIEKLLPATANCYEKTSFSAARASGLLDDLKATGRTQAVITGMEAHICVQQTALDLLAAEFQVFVVADAVCSRHRENYETALLRLRDAGIVTCDAESVVFEWLADAKHEHFKALQAFIR